MEFTEIAQRIGNSLQAQHLILATAESCTGGWVSEVVTSQAGSSAWFDRGFITYSNLAKQELLSVKENTLSQYGAVSEQTAREMAVGALKASQAHVSLSVTGIAGPDGGSVEKPVGTVWFAWASINKNSYAECQLFIGNRTAIRQQAVNFALRGLLQYLKSI